MNEKPRRLGRGLEALLGGAAGSDMGPGPGASVGAQSPLRDLPVVAISPNPFQVRRTFKPSELSELENSLRVSGLLQPVTVRALGDERYQLVTGERRLRAATRLGWATIPAVVKSLDDRAMLVLALVENLQRADLNPIDEALGLQRLMDEFGHTQQQVADAVGKDRSTVANLLRVLSLPEGIRRMVQDEQLTLGHARALLALPTDRAMLDMARHIVEKHLSVREVERITRHTKASHSTSAPRTGGTPPETTGLPSAQRAEMRRLSDLLRRRLQTDVRIDLQRDSRGSMSIAFYSIEDLHRLAELVLGSSIDDS